MLAREFVGAGGVGMWVCCRCVCVCARKANRKNQNAFGKGKPDTAPFPSIRKGLSREAHAVWEHAREHMVVCTPVAVTQLIPWIGVCREAHSPRAPTQRSVTPGLAVPRLRWVDYPADIGGC